METGALARMLVAYAKRREPVRRLIDDALASLGVPGKPETLFSVAGRLVARALETKLIADAMPGWAQEILDDLATGKVETFTDYSLPSEARGAGLWEAPRGALGHWNKIERGRIAPRPPISSGCSNGWAATPTPGCCTT